VACTVSSDRPRQDARTGMSEDAIMHLELEHAAEWMNRFLACLVICLSSFSWTALHLNIYSTSIQWVVAFWLGTSCCISLFPASLAPFCTPPSAATHPLSIPLRHIFPPLVTRLILIYTIVFLPSSRLLCLRQLSPRAAPAATTFVATTIDTLLSASEKGVFNIPPATHTLAPACRAAPSSIFCMPVRRPYHSFCPHNSSSR
jgi:hypothetical protein